MSRLHNTVPTVQVCPATHSRNAREVFRDAIGVSSRVADAVFGCELDQLLERNPMIHLRGYETKLSISSSPRTLFSGNRSRFTANRTARYERTNVHDLNTLFSPDKACCLENHRQMSLIFVECRGPSILTIRRVYYPEERTRVNELGITRVDVLCGTADRQRFTQLYRSINLLMKTE